MSQNYGEICPQCRRGLNGSLNRLIIDTCGHFKCRFCLLQELNGCLKCSKEKQSPLPPPQKAERPSVIVSLAKPEKTVEVEEERTTKHIIEHSMKKDILFPTEIVKKDSSFYHLKRLISRRYYSEGGGKEDKACGTDPPPVQAPMPSHIVRFCVAHNTQIESEEELLKHEKCKPNKCGTCDKTFKSKQHLSFHQRVHRKLRFTCNTCSKAFKDNFTLQTHIRVHTGEKEFKCHLCPAEFKQRNGLKRHLYAHEGVKPFQCTQCDYGALSNDELTRHIRKHTGGKKLSCVCGLKFSQKRALVRHKNTHHNPSPSVIACHCGAKFKRKDNLVRHLKNTHQEGNQDITEREDSGEDQPHPEENEIVSIEKTLTVN